MRYLEKRFRVGVNGLGNREICPNCNLPLKIIITYLKNKKEIKKSCSCGYSKIKYESY